MSPPGELSVRDDRLAREPVGRPAGPGRRRPEEPAVQAVAIRDALAARRRDEDVLDALDAVAAVLVEAHRSGADFKFDARIAVGAV